MSFTTPPDKTARYIRSLIKDEGAGILDKILLYAKENFVPVIPKETSAFLKNLICLKKPEKILEIGAAIGYSGHIMLLNSPLSMLYTIEINEEYAETALKFFKESNLSDRVRLFIGDAADILPSLDTDFDFIFLDGPKAQYIEYLPFLKRRLSSGGVLLCDNVLYSGMVAGVNPSGKKKGLVNKIDLFLNALFSDSDFSSALLPLGDGLSFSIKK